MRIILGVFLWAIGVTALAAAPYGLELRGIRRISLGIRLLLQPRALSAEEAESEYKATKSDDP